MKILRKGMIIPFVPIKLYCLLYPFTSSILLLVPFLFTGVLFHLRLLKYYLRLLLSALLCKLIPDFTPWQEMMKLADRDFKTAIVNTHRFQGQDEYRQQTVLDCDL